MAFSFKLRFLGSYGEFSLDFQVLCFLFLRAILFRLCLTGPTLSICQVFNSMLLIFKGFFDVEFTLKRSYAKFYLVFRCLG
jgi:hypothetical protein